MLGALGNLISSPLHPAVVQLPIALAMLSPLVAGATLFAIHKGARPLRTWGITMAMLAATSVSVWVSLKTGGAQADAVQGFFILSLIVLGVGAVGFAKGSVGRAARGVATSGTLALVISGYRVGRAGGEVVYKYGAASAYAATPATSGGVAGRPCLLDPHPG